MEEMPDVVEHGSGGERRDRQGDARGSHEVQLGCLGSLRIGADERPDLETEAGQRQ